MKSLVEMPAAKAESIQTPIQIPPRFARPNLADQETATTPRSVKGIRRTPSRANDVHTPQDFKETHTPKSIDRFDSPTRPKRNRKPKLDPAKAKLVKYAHTFFKELSETVFGGRFGEETNLEWSNRLTRTAGKAHYTRYAVFLLL